MKDYFIRLINYNRYANLLIADLICKSGDPAEPVRLMAHLLAAQQVWLARCHNESTTGFVLWPEGNADTFAAIIENNHKRWVGFLEGLTPADFDRRIAYVNFKGETLENTLDDILAHLVNHGTHHRAQAGQYLKAAGAENLPVTDYIFYLRQPDLQK